MFGHRTRHDRCAMPSTPAPGICFAHAADHIWSSCQSLRTPGSAVRGWPCDRTAPGQPRTFRHISAGLVASHARRSPGVLVIRDIHVDASIGQEANPVLDVVPRGSDRRAASGSSATSSSSSSRHAFCVIHARYSAPPHRVHDCQLTARWASVRSMPSSRTAALIPDCGRPSNRPRDESFGATCAGTAFSSVNLTHSAICSDLSRVRSMGLTTASLRCSIRCRRGWTARRAFPINSGVLQGACLFLDQIRHSPALAAWPQPSASGSQRKQPSTSPPWSRETADWNSYRRKPRMPVLR
jgi:hypothetical protein